MERQDPITPRPEVILRRGTIGNRPRVVERIGAHRASGRTRDHGAASPARDDPRPRSLGHPSSHPHQTASRSRPRGHHAPALHKRLFPSPTTRTIDRTATTGTLRKTDWQRLLAPVSLRRTFASLEARRLRVTPYRLAGRSLRPSRPPLTRMCLRCAIHGFAGHIRRLNGRGNPSPPGFVGARNFRRRRSVGTRRRRESLRTKDR